MLQHNLSLFQATFWVLFVLPPLIDTVDWSSLFYLLLVISLWLYIFEHFSFKISNIDLESLDYPEDQMAAME